MKSIIGILVVFSFFSLAIAQKSKFDSLWVEKNLHDTVKVLDVMNYGIQIQRTSMDSALFYYHWAIELADEGMQNPSNSAKITRTLVLLKANIMRNIGIVYYFQGNYDKANEQYLKSLKISEELGDKKGMSSCFNNIGLIQQELGNYEKAIDFYMKCIKIREELGDKKTVAITYINIGNIRRRQKIYDKAIEHFLYSLRIHEEFGDKKGISSCFNNIGLVYNEMGSYDKAIEYYIKSLKLKEEIGDKNGSLSTLINLGSLNITLADSAALTQNKKLQYLNRAIEYGTKAIELAIELKAQPRESQAASTLMNAYKKLGNYSKALKYAEIYISTKDSMFSDEKTKTLTEMQAKYDDEKKQQEIDNQKLTIEKQEIDFRRQHTQRNFFVVGSFLLVLLVMVVYRGYRQKNQSNIIISEKNALIEQAFEEIKATSEALAKQNEKLTEQNDKITAQRDELERTQKQLIQSEKMASIGLLTAGIAHEINNPINFVYAGVNSITKDFMDIEKVLKEIKGIENDTNDPCKTINRILMLKEEYQFDEAYKAISQTIEDIKLGAERTAEIVEGLRNFSRTETEEWTPININKVIDGILVLLKNKYQNTIDIIKQFDDNIPEIECNCGKINQVVMNLLSNAIDAIEGKGVITINTKLSGKDCVVSIIDTGKGMNNETMSKIFDPFFTTKEVGKGTGLGLSITWGIIQEHKGYIDVHSKPGQGTEFIVKLPVQQS